MALPGVKTRENLPRVGDDPQTAHAHPSGAAGLDQNGWLDSVGINGWFASDSAVHLNSLAHKYLGVDKNPYAVAGDVRVMFEITVTSVQGMS